jgi:murein DD-endopeptidase MepM/ murein hydrolase activator NlpD
VRVESITGSSVSGVLSGEVLHFRALSDGAFEAIAAVPVDAPDSIVVPIAVTRSNGVVDTVYARLAMSNGDYRLEKLTVAPLFATPPDSVTQARIRREQAKAMDVSARSHTTQRLWASIVHPRDTRITSGFGHGREFNGQVQSRHMGTDFAGAEGSPVRAAARGVVALVDTFYLAGNVLYLDHGEGLVTAYFHLSRQDVAAGDTVEAGQVIGRVGATGRVTGPHLHWVARYGTISVDPTSLLRIMDEPVAATGPARTKSPG